MKIIVCPDSFKDAASSELICEAISKGLSLALPDADIQRFPMADGGENTLSVIQRYIPAQLITCNTLDPIGRPITAKYLLHQDEVWIELAEASGLQRLSDEERDVRLTSTLGTGLLIEDALKLGAQRINLFIGGSATNDAGLGIAAGLGWTFFNHQGDPIQVNGENLIKIQDYKKGNLAIPSITVYCDVNNPFTGPKGAVHTFASQKGASASTLALLEDGMKNIASLFARKLDRTLSSVPATGAAGGVSGGMYALFNAKLTSASDYLFDLSGLLQALPSADLIITAEGKLDAQTPSGKLISKLAEYAKTFNKPVYALCGMLDLTPQECMQSGITAAFSIQKRPVSLKEALADTLKNLEEQAFHIGQIINNC